MSGVGTTQVSEGVGVLTIDNPPVNALGIKTREAIMAGMAELSARDDVKAIVLMCGGVTFFAGADISEFGKPLQRPDLLEVLNAIENSTKPVVAAIHGSALGGGYELALVCHYRIALPSAKVGLPEVNLGLLPGAGGTQRLPRIVGAQAALDIMTKGNPVPAAKALALGMIDGLAEEGRLREGAVAFARKLIAENAALLRVRDRDDKLVPSRGQPELFAEFVHKNDRAFRGFKAPYAIVKAVEAAVELPFEAGMAREAELFRELVRSNHSAAQRYYFFAEREAAKVPDLPKQTATRPVDQAGVIGAGTMGGGIAMNFANAGIPVTLVETSQASLDRGIAIIRKNYEATAAKGRMTAEQVEQRMALITPTLEMGALGTADLIVEAIYEEMAVKKDVFAQLDRIAKAGAILASNTSFLDLDEIAAATARPGDVIGLHFFSPANVMRLLEIVRGSKTTDDVLATALKLARRIGKVPVVSRVGPGFIANRVMAPRSAQAFKLVLQGPTPKDIDAALFDYGFAMGPFAMTDLVGLDVLGRGSSDRTLIGDLAKAGRLGQKQGGGFYDYDEKRKAGPSAEAARIIAEYAAFAGIPDRVSLDPEEIVARLLAPVVNEGAKVLEEGVAIRASDIDVACIVGYNWPLYTGGPMFWADTVGLDKIVEALKALGLEPANLLAEKVAAGGSFTR